MQYRDFGNTGLRVSALGVGCGQLGSALKRESPAEIVAMLHQACDSGINFFDTADSYGQGESERLLGRALRGRRHRVCVLSKAGFTLSPLGRLAAAARPLKALLRSVAGMIAPSRQALGQLRGGFNRQNFSPAYIERAIEGSLRRLATDYLDVFHLHNPRLPPAEMDALIALLDRLQRQGKIRFYGISGETVDDLIATLDTPNLSSVNVEINLLHQAARERLLPLCVERGIAVVGRQPFASGVIFDRDLGPEELRERLRPYRALAEESGIPLARLALQFVLQLAGISVVVVGMRTLRHLDANLSILASPPLGALALERLGTL